jgi:lipopolysaccharide export system permease protein
MFTRLDRYVLRQLLGALLAVTTALVALIWLTQSLKFVELVVNRGLSFRVFLQLTSLMIPGFVAVILPITTFVVVQFTYQRLTGDRELTVMRAAGMSDAALARPALGLAVVVMLGCYALNLFAVPAALSQFRDYQYEIRNQIAAFLLEPGVFTPVSSAVTVYVQSRGTDNSLGGIIIEDGRQTSSPSTILARSGQLMVTSEGPMVLLLDGSREQVDAKTGRLDMLTFARNMINLADSSKTAAMDMTDAAEAPMEDLLHPNVALTRPEAAKWLVEAYRRLSAPLTVLSFTLIGLFATLGGRFRRHGGVLRPVGAVVGVTLLVALDLGVNNFAARNLDLLPLIWVATVAPGVIAAILLFWPKRMAASRTEITSLGGA